MTSAAVAPPTGDLGITTSLQEDAKHTNMYKMNIHL